MKKEFDVVIVGNGAAGLFTALHMPTDKHIAIITKGDMEESDSFLAQGGICVLKNEEDYQSYFEDTMRAGHYENRKESVDIMIRGSRDVINTLLSLGVEFEKDEKGNLCYTKEGAHSKPRICFHEDITGEAITTKLLKAVKACANVTIKEFMTMTDIIEQDKECVGVLAKDVQGKEYEFLAEDVVLATGGIGGLYKHSTNFPILTGDGCSVAEKHGVELEHMDYIQIHPTCLYSDKPGRSFLITESARGEGAVLLNHKGERFTDELQPRDIVAAAIKAEMEKEGVEYEYLSFAPIDPEEVVRHFPHIYEHCLEEGYDILKEPIPIVPAQHYFMGGIHVDSNSKTTMEHLYAVGETSCNGVHGKNRLASNSLLESLVFAKRAAREITNTQKGTKEYESNYYAISC